MEGTIGEIRMFAGNFAPRNWAFCQGQIMSIASNTALFSILGTTYGGNGQTTFALPDFRGRVAVGTGTGPGLTNVQLGQISGTETVTLLTTQIPAHIHTATAGTGGSGTATLNAVTANGNTQSPSGNYLAASRTASVASYIESGTTAAMNAGSITLSNITAGAPTIGITGGSQPHSNMQPYLGMNYVICLFGIFPSRD
jgi:microcystin-dependent protein